MCRIICACLLSGFALSVNAAPLPATLTPETATNPTLTTTAGGFRVCVERVVQNASYTLEFAQTDTQPADGRQTIYLHFAVISPDRDRLSALTGLGKECVAVTNTGQRVTLRPYPSSEGAAADGRTWRTYVIGQDVDAEARSFRTVDGSLLAYPSSRAARVEFDLSSRSPQTQLAGAMWVSLISSRTANGVLMLRIQQRCPSLVALARLRPEIPYGVLALSRAGVPSYALESRSSASVRKDIATGDQIHELEVAIPFSAEVPTKIQVEALLRSGTPQSVPFRLEGVPLPGSGPSAGAAARPTDGEITPADHPDLSRDAGVRLNLTVKRAGAPAGAGVLSVGLMSTGGRSGSWRWLTVRTDGLGKAVIPNLKPGRYQARLIWSDDAGVERPASGRWVNDRIEFVAAAGKPVDLPVLEWRETTPTGSQK